MRRLALPAALPVLACLCACGHSPPTRFFTLDPVIAPAPAARALSAPVQLDAVHIPAALDRPELVVQTGPNQVRIDEQDQWAAPLGQMMRRVLAEDLLARLPAGGFILPDAPHSKDAKALVVTVLQMKSDADGSVELEANWTLMAGTPSTPLLSRDAKLSASGSGTGPAAQAAAISQVIGQLADRIATGLGAR